MSTRICKDCHPSTKRPAPHPGPRCFTHHKIRKTESKNKARDAHYQSTYGISLDEYNELYTYQGSVCAICIRATGASKNLAVDHDHKTGKVRGLLCGPCNKILGHGRDDPAFFVRALEYLESTPFDNYRSTK